MPNKNTKRARRAGTKINSGPAPKDDGTRWLVVRASAPVYRSHSGTTRAEAERLAEGLLEPAELIQIAPAPQA